MAPGARAPAIAPGAAPPPPAAAAGQARAAGSPAPNDAAAGLAFVSAAQRIAAAGAAGSDPAGAGTALLGASFEWPLRLLRWLNEGPQGATAWLRDFTLAPEAMPALVDDLRRFAAAENLPLDRIVLNGRTLWSATSLPPSTP
jgi:hypothetical protein